MEEFGEQKYALEVWAPDKIAFLEKQWSKQREYWYNLLNPLIPSGNQNVLDVGCGIGAYYDLLKKKAKNYVGIDITENMVKLARKRHPEGDFRVGGVLNLPSPDESFDLVYCWSVLVHLPHNVIEKSIKELWRVTKKHLFFNLYITKENNFSVRGPWNEFLTAVNEEWLFKLISSFNIKDIRIQCYEGIDVLGDKEFQRKIYLWGK